VQTGSPADIAGIKSKDIILQYQVNKIFAEKREDLNKFTLLLSKPGGRKGQTQALARCRD